MNKRLYIVVAVVIGLICLVSSFLVFGQKEELSAAKNNSKASSFWLAEDRPYDSVTWMCSHNAMSNAMDQWMGPNQNWNISKQLEEGVHAQMWDIWPDQTGKLWLKHGNGKIFFVGKKGFSEALREVVLYLKKEPKAIVTLLFENYAKRESIEKDLELSGALEFCYLKDPTQKWPTLGEMRKSGKRLVLFCDRIEGNIMPKGVLPMWQHCVETPWNITSKEKLASGKERFNRGNPQNSLLILNHFISGFLPSFSIAQEVNSTDFLEQRKKSINKVFPGRKIQFWVVDFVDVAEYREFIRKLNTTQN